MTTNYRNKITKNRNNQMSDFACSNTNNTISLNAFAFMTSKEFDLEIQRQVDAMPFDVLAEYVCDLPFLSRWMCLIWLISPDLREGFEEKAPLMVRYLSKEKQERLERLLFAKMEEMKDVDGKLQFKVVER